MGTGLAYTLGASPQITIIVAQAANAILLPIVAAFLVYVVNRADLMGDHCNRPVANVLAIGVLIVTIAIGARSLFLLISH